MALSDVSGAAAPHVVQVGFNVTQGLIFRVSASATLAMAGGYYLLTGKRDASAGAMMTGAFLLLLSMLVFL